MSDAWCFFEKFWHRLLKGGYNNVVIGQILEWLHGYVKEEIHKSNWRNNRNLYLRKSSEIKFCETKLNEIFDLLSASGEGRDLKFLKHFPEWKKCRKQVIKKFITIAETIESQREIVSYAKIVGSGIGIAGGATLMASVLCPPVGIVGGAALWLSGTAVGALVPACLLPSAVATGLAVTGGIATATGGATQIGASITEGVLLNRQMKKAIQLIKKDIKEFRHMAKWFKHSKELIERLNSILDFDIWEEVFGDIKLIIPKILEADSKIKFFNTLLMKMKFKMFLPREYKIVVIAILLAISFIKRENLISLDSLKNVVQITSVYNIGLTVSSVSEAIVVKAGTAGAATVTRALGILAGVGIALDSVNIALNAIDIAKGSNCKEGNYLKAASQELKEELEVITKIRAQIISNVENIRRNIIKEEIENVNALFTQDKMIEQTDFCKNIIEESAEIGKKIFNKATEENLNNFEFQDAIKRALKQLSQRIEAVERQRNKWYKTIYFTRNYFINTASTAVLSHLKEWGGVLDSESDVETDEELNEESDKKPDEDEESDGEWDDDYSNFFDIDGIEYSGIYKKEFAKFNQRKWSNEFIVVKSFIENEIKRIEIAMEKSQNDVLEDLLWSSQKTVNDRNRN